MSTFRRRLTQRYSTKIFPKISDVDVQAQTDTAVLGEDFPEDF